MITYSSITITDLEEASQFWTASQDPTTPDYTFTIANLTGDTNADIKVGDVIFHSHYRYTVLSVDSTTVRAGNRVSIKGVDAISPTIKSIVCSHAAAVCGKDGTYNPTTVQFSGQAQQEETIEAYNGYFVIDISSDGSTWVRNYAPTTKATSTNYTIPLGVNISKNGVIYPQGAVSQSGTVLNTNFTITSEGVVTTTEDVGFIIRSIRCSLYADYSNGTYSNLVDQQRINIAFDGVDGDKGDDAYSVTLTNENYTFSGNSKNAVPSNINTGFNVAECNVITYYGGTLMPCTIGTITGMPTGMTATVSNNNSTGAKFTVTVANTMISQNGVLNIPITVDDKLFNMKFSYSLKLNGLDSTGLGLKINHSDLSDTMNYGKGVYYAFDEETKEARMGNDVYGWVLWNGQEISIPTGCYINPNGTMDNGQVIYSVYSLTTPTSNTGTFHDVTYMPYSNSWSYNTYTTSPPSSISQDWTWNEATDIILAMYTLPATGSEITNVQLFTPPKKFSELAEMAIQDTAKTVTRFTTNLENGVFVHPENDITNGVRIQDSVDIIRDNESVANFGAIARVGKETASHMAMEASTLSAYSAVPSGGNPNLYFQVGDGTANGTLTYVVPEQHLVINLQHPIESVTSVSDGGTVKTNGTHYTWNPTEQFVTLNYIPSLLNGSSARQIAVTYTYLNSTDLSGGDETTSGEASVVSTTETYTMQSSDRPNIVIQLDSGVTTAPTVTVNGSVVSSTFNSSNHTVSIDFQEAGAVVNVAYTVTKKSPYFTFNNRKSNSTIGNGSVAMGNNGVASGNFSFVGGVNCEALQDGSMAVGEGVKVNAQDGFSCGKYNVANSNVLFNVGNGTGDDDRSDALWVGTDGDIGINGQMYVGQSNASNKLKLFATGQKIVDNIKITASSTSGTRSILLTKSGYTPMAIRGIRLNNASSNGGGASYCSVYAWAISGNRLFLNITNNRTADSRIKIIVDVFYIATNAL